MYSKATSVAAYLAELTPERRAAIEAVRSVVLANMDPLLQEGIQYGMISWHVPHSVFPPGYHCAPEQPLPYACLASQKNHLSLYLMNVYADGTPGENWFRAAWAKSGKRLDMGKSCLRFRSADDLALDVIGAAFKRHSVQEHLAQYAQWDPRNRTGATKTKPRAKAKAKTRTKARSRATTATRKAPARKK